MNSTGLQDPLVARLERLGTLPRTVDSGRFVYHQGDEVISFYIVCEGTARVARLTYEGHEISISQAGPGELLGEMEVALGLERRECFAQATSELSIAPVALVSLPPAIRAELQQSALRQLYQNQLCHADLLPLQPNCRVISYLRHLATFDPVITLSHGEIGRRIGCPRETVSRTLRKLKEDGVVELDRGSITVLAPRRLEV